jgi:hypothetical protein
MAWCGGLRADHGQKHDPGDEISFRGGLTNEGPLQKHYFGRFLRLMGETGFPNHVFNDSWVVGFLEG